jgi:hypothetical protein
MRERLTKEKKELANESSEDDNDDDELVSKTVRF